MQYSLILIGLYSLKVVGSLQADVDGPTWVKLYILCCVEVDGPVSSFSRCPCYVEVDKQISIEVCGCCLSWCLYRCPKCVTLSVETEEIFSSIDNFTTKALYYCWKDLLCS